MRFCGLASRQRQAHRTAPLPRRVNAREAHSRAGSLAFRHEGGSTESLVPRLDTRAIPRPSLAIVHMYLQARPEQNMVAAAIS